MPAFTFEKISPPVPRGPVAPTTEKPRGRIGQILDRFTGARGKRGLRDKHPATAPQEHAPPK